MTEYSQSFFATVGSSAHFRYRPRRYHALSIRGLGYDPGGLANLMLWYDATSFDLPNDTTVCDGTNDWKDLAVACQNVSGYGMALYTGNEADRPKFKTNIFNGLPGIYFDGGDNVGWHGGQTCSVVGCWTVMWVGKCDSAADRIFLGANPANNQFRLGYADNAFNVTFYSTTSGLITIESSIAQTNARSLFFRNAGSDFDIFENGKTKGGAVATPTDPMVLMTIGTCYAVPYAGHMAELALWQRALSDQEIYQLHSQYLAPKWGL
jgi:hypothetical protein